MTGLLHDTITSGGGKDIFDYRDTATSASLTYDTISDADFDNDKFDVNGTIVTRDSPVITGTLNNTSQPCSTPQLTAAVSSLGARHAVLFTPDSGTLHGHTFLIVDQNALPAIKGAPTLSSTSRASPVLARHRNFI